MLRSFIKKNQREGMNMETILFSKTDKIKIVTFAAVAFGLPWLLLPQIRVEGILAYNIPASYMMILPTFGRSEERRVGKECRSRWSPYH